MERNERLETIYSEFDAAAQELCDDTGGILCEITSEYKGEEEERELKYRFAKIYYGSFICELVYRSIRLTARSARSTAFSAALCMRTNPRTRSAFRCRWSRIFSTGTSPRRCASPAYPTTLA